MQSGHINNTDSDDRYQQLEEKIERLQRQITDQREAVFDLVKTKPGQGKAMAAQNMRKIIDSKYDNTDYIKLKELVNEQLEQ